MNKPYIPAYSSQKSSLEIIFDEFRQSKVEYIIEYKIASKLKTILSISHYHNIF